MKINFSYLKPEYSLATDGRYQDGAYYLSAERKLGEHEFEGEVAGSEKEPYHVMIDTEHPKKSTCNCPHAEGKKIVCKHKIALFFTVFSKESDRYIAEIEEYEREEEEREQEHYDQIVKYVKSLSKEELRIALINALIEAEERDLYRY